MEQILERVQKVVADYNPTKDGGRMKTIRSLLPALGAVRKFIIESSQDDRGCAQRIARELDEVLAELPDFKAFSDKQAQAARHTKRLAEEHLDDIENYLKRLVAEDDASRKKVIHEWVKAHGVFGELKRVVTAKSLPKKAYVLLFKKRAAEDGVELLTRRTPENAVISRMRPHEFFDDFRVNKAYSRMDIVGAAVIAEQQLIAVVGQVPVPRDKQTQLQALLAVSKEAVGRPAQEFIEENRVLKQLYDMARRRKMPKDAYVLLFQQTEEDGEEVFVADVYEPPAAKQNTAGKVASRDEIGTSDSEGAQSDFDETAAGDDQSHHEDSDGEHHDAENVDEHSEDSEQADAEDLEDPVSAGEEPAPEPAGEMPAGDLAPPDISDDASAETLAADTPEFDESDDEDQDADEPSEEPSEEHQDADEPSDEPSDEHGEDDDEQVDHSDAADDHDSGDVGSHEVGDSSAAQRPSVATTGPINVRIVVRKTSDGKVITRFWSADFAVKHKLFDEFKEKPTIVGAAIVKRTDLVKVLGRVPVSAGSQSRFDAVMQASRLAVEKPSLEFVSEHEVLRGLHELATKDSAHRDACVIMFVLGEGGRVEVASGDPVGPTMPLAEFRSAKLLHDKFFGKPNLVGASVVAPGVGRPRDDRDRSGSDNRGGDRGGKGRPDNQRRDSSAPKPSVIAAFGRTPLKVSLLATPENFNRLGINVDTNRLFESERQFRPGMRPMRGGKPQQRRDPHDNRDRRGPREPRPSAESRGPQDSRD